MQHFFPCLAIPKKFTDGNDRQCPYVDITASRNGEGTVHITLTNVSLDHSAEVLVNLGGKDKAEVRGEILISENIQDHNDFGSPDKIRPAEFKSFKVKDGNLVLKLPAKSIVSLSVNL